MKKLIGLSLLLTLSVASVFANGINIDPRVEELFAREFAGAENVKWVKLDKGFQKASFTFAGTGVEAYFSPDAELVGTARNLFYNQLPLVVIKTVNNKFANGIVLEAQEITNRNGTTYKITLENNSKRYDISLNNLGEITEFEKVKTTK